MADDDKQFEAALAGFLHREKRDSERHVFCPEPELLAAYYEGTLSPEEKQVARLHIEGCAHCQESLSHLKTTEHVPLVATPDTSDSVYFPPLTFPGSAAHAPRHSHWRWIAPAGAVAAGLALWLAYHQGGSAKFSSEQVAENRPEAYATPAPESSSQQSHAPLPERSSPPDSKSPDKTERSPSPSGAKIETRETAKAGAQKRTDQLSDAALESKAAQESSTDSVPSGPERNAFPPTAAPAPSAKARSAQTAQLMDADAYIKKKRFARLDAPNALVIIHTPDASIVWRVGTAGSMEMSLDGGDTWHSQISGVTADLAAGSAPLPNICWVVGRAGTILLTTDSGATWRKVKSPTAKDVAGVVAADSLKATVWDIGNEKFQTVDGGLTWTRGSSE